MRNFFMIAAYMLFTCAVGFGAFLFGSNELFHLQHNVSKYLQSNSTYHWHACEQCGEEVDTAEHDYSNTPLIKNDTHHWYECKDCGYKMEKEEHDWEIVVTAKDDTYHWYECKDCGQKHEVSEHVYNEEVLCNDSNNHWYECGICGQKHIKENHSWVLTGKNLESHWYECEDCGRAAQKYDHNINEGLLYKDETNHWKQCSDCGQKTEVIAHTYTLKENATHHWYECDCGYKKTEEEHTLNTTEYKLNETHHWYECDCGYKGAEVAHSWEETVIREATHQQDGVKKYECEDCKQFKLEDYSINSEITEEDWQQVQNINNLNKVQITETMYYDGHASMSLSIIKDGNKTARYYENDISIYSEENGKYYWYEGVVYEASYWTKTEIRQDEYIEYSDIYEITNTLFMQYQDLTYNAELRAYEYNMDIDGKIVPIKYYFKDGKLISVKAEIVNAKTVVTFEYNDVSIELPGVLTQEEWINAFDFDEIDNYQIEVKRDGVTFINALKDGDTFYTHKIEEDGENELYATIENGQYFLYSKNEELSTWSKISSNEEEYLIYDYSKNMDEIKILFSYLKYNEQSKAFEASDIYFSGDYVDHLQVYFEDGRMTKFVLEDAGFVGEILISYNQITLTLPQI